MVADPSLSMVGTITYYAVNQIGTTGCESTTRTAVTLTINPAPGSAISGGDQTECEERSDPDPDGHSDSECGYNISMVRCTDRWQCGS